jgi:thiopurine S-methyltransferase
MQPEFWQERWRLNEIGFHQSQAAGGLTRNWRSLKLAPGARIFVPLCGKSLDLLWLRDQGHPVVGVELSEVAVQAFFMENGIAARRRVLPEFDRYEATGLEVYRGDFFALSAARLGAVGAVYDRASLISWTPELRDRYARHLTDLTPAGAPTLLVTLEYDQAQKNGPPFSIDTAEVRRLYAADYAIEELSREDVLDSEPRMRARGVTQLHEVCYRLTRLGRADARSRQGSVESPQPAER